MSPPKVLVFASGSKDGGGSGFLHLILNVRSGVLRAEIVGVVSNHEHGGVRKIADRYGIKFYHLTGPYTVEKYQAIVEESGATWFLLSGWLKFVRGLPANRTINIHPGCTKRFGGPNMHGHHVHEATIASYGRGEVTCSYVTMHFVTEAGYDLGPVFFRFPVGIEQTDTADDLAARVNRYEHGWQSFITDLVVNGEIVLHNDGHIQVPEWYKRAAFCPEELRAA